MTETPADNPKYLTAITVHSFPGKTWTSTDINEDFAGGPVDFTYLLSHGTLHFSNVRMGVSPDAVVAGAEPDEFHEDPETIDIRAALGGMFTTLRFDADGAHCVDVHTGGVPPWLRRDDQTVPLRLTVDHHVVYGNSDRDAYITSVFKAVNGRDGIHPEVARYLTDRCTECGRVIGLFDDGHVVIERPDGRTAVIVGCEGYRIVNPNVVGINAPNWSDWNGNEPVPLEPVGVMDPSTYRLLAPAERVDARGRALNKAEAYRSKAGRLLAAEAEIKTLAQFADAARIVFRIDRDMVGQVGTLLRIETRERVRLWTEDSESDQPGGDERESIANLLNRAHELDDMLFRHIGNNDYVHEFEPLI